MVTHANTRRATSLLGRVVIAAVFLAFPVSPAVAERQAQADKPAGRSQMM